LKNSAETNDAVEKKTAERAAHEKAKTHLAEASEKPVCRRYEVNDSTIQKLGELLAENPNGLLLVRDELSGFLRSLDDEEKAGDRQKYLEMWDGKGNSPMIALAAAQLGFRRIRFLFSAAFNPTR
jgi:uncharacterized protein DUF3987